MKNTLMIKKNYVFKYVFKKGNYYKGEHVAVHALATKNSQVSLDSKNFLGVCVSKKNGNSVVRNRLKRIARQVYTNEETKLKKGYNYIIVYKKDKYDLPINFNAIESDIKKCFKELDLYEENTK